MSTARGIRNPEKLWFVLGAAVLLLCLGAFVWWALGVHQRAADRLAEIEPRHARLAGMLQDKERFSQAQQALQANLAMYVYPPDADASQVGNNVLQRVRELAGAQGLRVTSSQTTAAREDKDHPGFERVGISLRLEGDWNQFQRLWPALADQRPAVYGETVQLQAQGARSRELPGNIQVQLNLFVLKERQP